LTLAQSAALLRVVTSDRFVDTCCIFRCPELALSDPQVGGYLTGGWLAALDTTGVFLLDQYLALETELGLALHLHADNFAEVTGAVLTAVAVPHVAVVVDAAIVLAVICFLGNALRTTGV